jgi:recombination protein RecR
MASQEIERTDPGAIPPAGAGPALGAARGAVADQAARNLRWWQLLDALDAVRERLVECATCGNVDTTNPCGICADPRRDARSLCVVEDVADLWALDRAAVHRALSRAGRAALRARRRAARRPDHRPLIERVAQGGIDEVVLAMNATLEGQTTAHYIAERLEGCRCGSPSWPTACRWGASWTISTRARWRRRCGRGGRWVEWVHEDTKGTKMLLLRVAASAYLANRDAKMLAMPAAA